MTPRPVLLLLLVAALSCTGDRATGPGPETNPMRVGSEGGTIQSADGALTLVIPAGALAQPVTFAVAATSSHPGGAAGMVYNITPSGTQFSVPATLRLRLPAALPPGVTAEELRVATVTNGRWSAVQTSHTAGALEATIPHLSTWGVVSRFATEAETCPQLQFATSRGMPLDWVEIAGVPAGFGELLAVEFERLGGGDSFPAPALRTESGKVFLSVPVHPSASAAGGAVAARLIDAQGRTCQPVPFVIDALPPATGRVAAIASDLAALLRSHAAVAGTTVEALAAMNAADVPQTMQPVRRAWDALGNPASPNNLMAVLSGTAPVAQEHPIDLDLLDRLVARTGLDVQVRAVLPPAQGVGSGASAADCGFDIVSARELDCYMRHARRLQSISQGRRNEVLSDFALLATHLAVLPSPQVKAGALVASLTLLAFTEGAASTAGSLPTEFASITFDVTPDRFMADDNATGEWSAVKVVATSTGHDGQEALIGAVLQMAGFLMPGPSPGTLSTAELWLTSFAQHGLMEVLAHANRVAPTRGPTQPRTFGPIDITAADGGVAYSQGRGAGAVTMVDRTTYRLDAAWLGPMQGLVEVRTADGMFGGAQILDTRTIDVDETRITISPAGVVAGPGETVDFEVEVHASARPDITFSVGAGSVLHTPLGDGRHALRYTAPEGFTLTQLHVQLADAGGLYANPARPLPATSATIRERTPASLRISPRDACLAPAQTLQFEAAVAGVDDTAVTWAASVGHITPAGLYTAPGQPGNAIITATSVADPTLVDNVTILLGPCTCRSEARLPFAGVFTGDRTLIDRDDLDGEPAAGRLSQIWFFYGDNSLIRFWFAPGAGPLPGQTGTFQVEAEGLFTAVGYGFGTMPPGFGLPTHVNLVLDAFDSGPEPWMARLRGSVSGDVSVWMSGDPHTPPFTAPIEVDFDALYDWHFGGSVSCSGLGW